MCHSEHKNDDILLIPKSLQTLLACARSASVISSKYK